MFDYRARVFECYASAMSAAVELALRMSAELRQGEVSDDISELRAGAAVLRQRVETFLSLLPEGQRDSHSNGLGRHLNWLDRRLLEREPDKCETDIRDILERDLPERWKEFNDWFREYSVVDDTFVARLDDLNSRGHSDSAVRTGWAAFKTRLVERFDVPDNIDGRRLVEAIFGVDGRARGGSLPDRTCDAYRNLLLGLYSLSRNPTAHNDRVPNQIEAEAVLGLLATILGDLASARRH